MKARQGDDGLEPLTEWRDCLRTAGYTAEALEAAFALPKDVAALKALLGLDGEHNRIAWLGFVGAVRMRLHIAAPEPDVAPPPLPRRFERAPAVRSIAWSALFAANCATFVMAVLSHGFSLATAEDVVSALGLAITLWAFSLCCCVLEGLLSQPILVFVMDSKSGWNDDPSMREPILALVQYGSVRFWCGCSDRAAVDLLLYALAFLSFFTADMTGYATASLGIIHSMRFFAEVSTAYTMLAGLAERLKYLCAAEILARCEEAVAATSEWEQWRQHVLLGRCHLANHILWHATVGHGHRQLAQAAKRHDLPPIAQRLQQQQEQQQHDLPPIVPSPAEAAVAPSSGSRPERTL